MSQELYRWLVKPVIDSNSETDTEVLQTSGMIGISGMQNGESALELSTKYALMLSTRLISDQIVLH